MKTALALLALGVGILLMSRSRWFKAPPAEDDDQDVDPSKRIPGDW